MYKYLENLGNKYLFTEFNRNLTNPVDICYWKNMSPVKIWYLDPNSFSNSA